MRTYEIVLIVRPVAEAARKKAVDAVKDLLKGMKIKSEKELGSKALKYKIKRELTGFYYDFEIEGEAMPVEFDKKLSLNETILRHLVVRK
ncbi:MAG TPA: 30S ribosomal protein S6 [Patescibacteria group bacterium]